MLHHITYVQQLQLYACLLHFTYNSLLFNLNYLGERATIMLSSYIFRPTVQLNSYYGQTKTLSSNNSIQSVSVAIAIIVYAHRCSVITKDKEQENTLLCLVL